MGARAKREGISKKTRFEVFKRDKFTCQYCGKKAPDVVLHLDHIKPVADGGRGDILNLVTACAGCNGGKGARLLTDDSVVERQRLQIEELNERRQQLEMMLQWRDELSKIKGRLEDVVKKHIGDATGFEPNDTTGMVIVRKWLKSFPLDIVLSAVDDAYAKYGTFSNKGVMTEDSWGEALNKVLSFCRAKAKIWRRPRCRSAIVRSRHHQKPHRE
jgi:hypothetical protein